MGYGNWVVLDVGGGGGVRYGFMMVAAVVSCGFYGGGGLGSVDIAKEYEREREREINNNKKNRSEK